MNISIFGLGYVGAVLTGCLAKGGHRVIGVDTDASKVELVNRGCSPIIEKDLEPLIKQGLEKRLVSATTDGAAAVKQTEMSLVCVGTPSSRHGDLDLTFIRRVCDDIGKALKSKSAYHIVVVRSTMLPGSVRGTVIPALEGSSGKKAGKDFGVAINPEFLRESTAVYDFYNPPKTVIGVLSERDADLVANLYKNLSAPLIKTGFETAEMVKYVDNVFHALKITFANEIGSICKPLGVNAYEVMDIFCQDRKLNLSPAYLKPGFAFGGSCLPKDLRAITRLARAMDVVVPLLDSLAVSNEQRIRDALHLIQEKGLRRIGIMGFAFKAGTDDLRESPLMTLTEALLGKGYDLRLYDSSVSLARLMGSNRRYLEAHIPHFSRLMVDSIDELIAHAEVIVIGNENDEFFAALAKLSEKRFIIDLTARSEKPAIRARFEKLCS